MPLTPADVANKQFKIAFRGYSLDEVDSFLDEVEGELGRLLRENSDLRIGMPAAPAYAAPVAPPPPPTPVSAPLAPGEGQEAALRTLLLAQRTADEVVAEAKAEAAQIVAASQARAGNVDNEIAARISAAMGGLEQRKRDLEVQIEDLRAFEREYRTRLKAYLEGQLRDLSVRGAPDDGGAGVPAAARTAAVGLGAAAPQHASSAPAAGPAPSRPGGPVGGPPAPVGGPPGPVGGPPVPVGGPPAPPAAPTAPSYRPAEPPLTAPPLTPTFAPAPAPANPPATAPANPPMSAPAMPPAAPPAGSTPGVVQDAPAGPAAAPPSGPPREAEPPTLRAVPPLQSSVGPEPIGPFTIVPPTTFSEQLDDGPEPPAER